jgi:hypothetical protein
MVITRSSPLSADARHIIEKYWTLPLSHAVKNANGETRIVQELLEHGKEFQDVNKADEFGFTPLHNAAMFGYHDIVSLLLQHGADVSKVDQWGRTAKDRCQYNGPIALLEKAEVERTQRRFEAFAMGNKQRLGADSPVNCLDQGLVDMILKCSEDYRM